MAIPSTRGQSSVYPVQFFVTYLLKMLKVFEVAPLDHSPVSGLMEALGAAIFLSGTGEFVNDSQADQPQREAAWKGVVARLSIKKRPIDYPVYGDSAKDEQVTAGIQRDARR